MRNRPPCSGLAMFGTQPIFGDNGAAMLEHLPIPSGSACSRPSAGRP